MSFMNQKNIRDLGRLLTQDTDSTNPGLSDAQWNLLILDARIRQAEQDEDDLWAMSASQAGMSAGFIQGTSISLNAYTVTGGAEGSTKPPVLRWVKAFRETTNSAVNTGVPMSIVTPAEIHALLREDNTQGPPTHISFERYGNADGSTAPSWSIRNWPPTDATYFFSFLVKPSPIAVSNDTTAYLEMSPAEARYVAVMAAVFACPLLGMEEEYRQTLLAQLPDRLRELILNAPKAA